MNGSLQHAARRLLFLLAVVLAPAASVCQAKLQITTQNLPSGIVSVPYSQALTATDGKPPYAWSVSNGALPAGLALSSGGVISGTPQSSGTSQFTARVRDDDGNTDTQVLRITVNSNPVITATSLPNGTVGRAYSQSIQASGGSPPYTWSVAGGSLPAGLSLAAGGTISGTPGSAGSSGFTVRVTDSASASATAVLSLTINPPALGITTSSLPAGTVGAAYSQALGASGGSPPYSWSVASGALPAGLSLAAGGTISGTPGSAGLSSFTVRVTDSVSAFATAALSLTVNPPGLGITTSSLPVGTVGAAYSQALGASGGSPPYSWSVASGSLPAGLSLAAGGTISGTPGTAGLSSFTVRVTDSASAIATAALSLTVNPQVFGITTSSLPAGTVGAAYSQALGASGGSPPYSWSVASGSLPAGLSLAANGTVAGTPGGAGLSSFTVRVTDSTSASATAALSLTINPPVLGITTSSLAAGTVGAAYSQTLGASGGVPPYVWTVKTGPLPPGLALDPASNAIAGTPIANGAFAFTLQVADASGGSAARIYTLAVSLPPPPAVSLNGLPDPANAAAQPAFNVSLPAPYPVPLTGQIVLTFTADAEVPVDDPAVQFATGGRTLNFTIPAGSTTAVFSASQMALQTGTVAGTITLTLGLQSAKGEVTATSTRTLHVPRAAPVVSTVRVVHTAGGFELHVTGYSTPRQVTQAAVQLTPSAGGNLQTTQLTIPLTDLAGNWYQSAASSQFGSQFTLVLPFSIQGNAAGIDSVGVSLVNNQGSSPAVSAKF